MNEQIISPPMMENEESTKNKNGMHHKKADAT